MPSVEACAVIAKPDITQENLPILYYSVKPEYKTESNTRFIVTVDAAYPLIIKAAENACVQKIISISPADSLPQPTKWLYTLKNKPIMSGEHTICWKTFLEQGKGMHASPAPYQKIAAV